METKANYVAVGAFTLLAVIAAFIFVYWTATAGSQGETAPLRIVIPGSAAGLSRGSAVMFNGIRVGDVRDVFFRPEDPNIAIADAEVSTLTPLTRSTKASIGIAGLSGQANINLTGADPKEPNLLAEARARGTVAEIEATPSAVTNLLETAQDIFTRTDRVLTEVEGFVGEVRDPLSNTFENAEKFSAALAGNADGIDSFLKSVTALSDEVSGIAGKLDGTVKAAEALLQAVEPDKVRTIIANVETFTASIRDTGGDIDRLVADANGAIKSIDGFAKGATETLAKVDATMTRVEGVVAAVDPETVKTMLADIQSASADARKAASDFSKFTASVGDKGEDVAQIIAETRELAGRLNDASARIDGVLKSAGDVFAKVDEVAAAIDPKSVKDTLANLETAAANASQASTDIVKVTSRVGDRAADVDQIIGDARDIMGELKTASRRVDKVLASVDSLFGSKDGKGLMSDARDTLASYKRLADTFNARAGGIADGLQRFTGQGLQDLEALIQDGRRAITRIESAVSDLERNPQRILTGGEGTVRLYDGRARR
jgi:phospholipid/cholesterol/gamma-HCH transport system substrate-binding protein